jgi:hypothetical protein
MQQKTIDTLIERHCSLVVEKNGEMHLFFKQGVRDLEYLLKHNPQLLCGSSVADKVIGKAAAAMIAVGKVKELYAHVLSEKALGILDRAGIRYTYGTLIPQIIRAENDSRCPLETIVEDAETADEAVEKLFRHFDEMKLIKQKL